MLSSASSPSQVPTWSCFSNQKPGAACRRGNTYHAGASPHLTIFLEVTAVPVVGQGDAPVLSVLQEGHGPEGHKDVEEHSSQMVKELAQLRGRERGHTAGPGPALPSQ